MKRGSFRIWLLTAVNLALVVTGKTHAEVPATAKDRAALYQAEAARVFSAYHWRITQNRLGRLTMLHAAAREGAAFPDPTYDPGPSGMGPIMLHLTIAFQPESATSTRCLVQIAVYFTAGKDEAGKPMVLGPSDANSPENARHVRGWLADAEKRMTRKHPEYAAK